MERQEVRFGEGAGVMKLYTSRSTCYKYSKQTGLRVEAVSRYDRVRRNDDQEWFCVEGGQLWARGSRAVFYRLKDDRRRDKTIPCYSARRRRFGLHRVRSPLAHIVVGERHYWGKGGSLEYMAQWTAQLEARGEAEWQAARDRVAEHPDESGWGVKEFYIAAKAGALA